MQEVPEVVINIVDHAMVHLGQRANVHELPVVDPAFHDRCLQQLFQYYAISPEEMEKELHLYAVELLDAGKVKEAWQVLLALN